MQLPRDVPVKVLDVLGVHHVVGGLGDGVDHLPALLEHPGLGPKLCVLRVPGKAVKQDLVLCRPQEDPEIIKTILYLYTVNSMSIQFSQFNFPNHTFDRVRKVETCIRCFHRREFLVFE